MPDFKNRRTPGVYVTELDAFPPSVVGVPTAIPAFIGYTEDAQINGKPVFNTPVQITSLADYHAVFGGDVVKKFSVEDAAATDTVDLVVDGANKTLKESGNLGILYKSLQLFYNNCGGTCYVVSVGKYPASVKAD